jgi:hypothetical protein
MEELREELKTTSRRHLAAKRMHVVRSHALSEVWGVDVQSPFTADEVAVLQQSAEGGSGWARVTAPSRRRKPPRPAEPPKGPVEAAPLSVEDQVRMTEALVAAIASR